MQQSLQQQETQDQLNQPTDSQNSEKETEEDEQKLSKTKKNQTKKNDKTKLIMNVSDTKYPVVRQVAKKIFKWKLSKESDSMAWDIFWTDNAVQPEQLGKMQPYQKINHFPGMYSLARKNHLGRNIGKMKKQFPKEYKFFPHTWLLPSEYVDFKAQFQRGKARTFIVKPEASCQGRGIFLTRSIDSINPADHYVAQRYMHKPFLIDGLKFDLRVYVLLAGTDPMRIYLYQDGLIRFATEPYQPPNSTNLDDLCMHLTNYAINKENPNFVFNESKHQMDVGHKRSVKQVFQKMQENGHNIQKLWLDMEDIIIKTLCSAQPVINHHYKSCQPENFLNNMCFEILGFDIFVDYKLRPHLIEVNHTPSFTTDTPLDELIKKSLIRDALKLMNCNYKAKMNIINNRKEALTQRVLTGKKVKYTQEEKNELYRQAQIERDLWEDEKHGQFKKVYPKEVYLNHEYYDQFLQFAQKIYEESTGASNQFIFLFPNRHKKKHKKNIRRDKRSQVGNRLKAIAKQNVDNFSQTSFNPQEKYFFLQYLLSLKR